MYSQAQSVTIQYRPNRNQNNKKNKKTTRRPKQPKGASNEQRPRNQQTRRLPPQVPISQIMMHPTLTRYMAAIHNPWNPDAVGANVPELFSLPSQKVMVKTSCTMRIGANGNGAVAFYPFPMYSNDLGVSGNDIFSPIKFTSAAFNTPDFPLYNMQPASTLDPSVEVCGPTNSPYSRSTFTADTGRAVKLVGAGLRLSYTAKQLDCAGVVTVWRNPSASNYLGVSADNLSDLVSLQSAFRGRDDNHSVWELTYCPVTNDDTKVVFAPGQYITGALGQTDHIFNRLAGGIVINGASEDSTYLLEAVAHFEFYGKSLPKTQSHSEPTGMAHVIAAATATGVKQTAEEAHSNAHSYVASRLAEASGAVFRAAAPTLKRRFKRFGLQKVQQFANRVLVAPRRQLLT